MHFFATRTELIFLKVKKKPFWSYFCILRFNNIWNIKSLCHVCRGKGTVEGVTQKSSSKIMKYKYNLCI